MRRSSGFLHWVFPAMLGMLALTVLLSGRDLSQTYAALKSGEEVSNPIVIWAQRAVSVLLLVVSAERIVNHAAMRKHLPSIVLSLVFVVYWLATVAAPAVFGSHPVLSHEYLYTLVVGFAALLASTEDYDKALVASRNSLGTFLLAGVLLIPVTPALVMDNTYFQGLLAGVPRLGGLAWHPVILGMFAQIFLLCLLARPFGSRWLNRFAWLLGLGVLFFAQSKTAWIAFILCWASMLAVRRGPTMLRRLGDPHDGSFGMVMCAGVIVAVLGLTIVLLMGDIETQASQFLDTAEGAQLLSMTGRDQIWEIALEEWRSNPLFGYGPLMWDADFRATIGMPNATSAHNQFMDTLSRSGSIGAAALVLYAGVLLVMSLKYAKASGGLSLALFLALALRSVSEVPLSLFGYGSEFFTHLLLIVTLAAAAGAHRPAVAARAHASIYKAAS